MKTFVVKPQDIKPCWYLVDAKDKILGRVASKVASVLIGKHKPIYSANIDTGDYVIVVNAAKIRVTGKKLKDKIYRKYSGYPSGLKEITLERLLEKKPEQVMRLAVQRMLPQNSLGRKIIKKLKIYKDAEHLQKSQKPIVLEI